MGVEFKVLKDLDMTLGGLLPKKAFKVRVGFLGESGKKEHPGAPGKSLATIAAYQEFGTHQIPARSFLRQAVIANKDQFSKQIVASLVRKRRMKNAMGNLGIWFVSKIQNTMWRSRAWARPNRPVTLRKKKGTIPLIDTGYMAKHVTWDFGDG